MNILVSGGTIFVSKYISEYFRDLNYNVYIFNRGNNLQPEGVKFIKADRNNLGDVLKKSKQNQKNRNELPKKTEMNYQKKPK